MHGRAVILGWAACAAFTGPVLVEPVDVEIVLAQDGSGSIDEDEFRLQREGYAAAITDTRVLDAIAAGAHGAIAVAYIEWGAPDSQHLIAGWVVIRDRDSAEAFAEQLRTAPRMARGYRNAV
jgi:hypothetical protein